MLVSFKKFTAQVSLRERCTTTAIIHTQFFLKLFVEILSLTNVIIMAQRNDLSKLTQNLLFLFHAVQLDFIQKIVPVAIILVSSFSIFFYFLWNRNRSPYFGLFAKILPLGCALLLIQIETYIYHNHRNNQLSYCQYFIIILIIGLIWIVKLTAFPQNYMVKQSRLTKCPAFARTSIFILQIVALIFKVSINHFLLFTLLCNSVVLINSLFTFQYINKDFQYLHFLSKYLKTTVSLFYLLQLGSYLPENTFSQCLSFVVFFLLLASGLLKIIFQKKYSRILQNNNLQPSHIIVLYNLLLEQKDSSRGKRSTSIFTFSPDKFASNIMMKRLFHKQKKQNSNDESQQQLLIKRTKLLKTFKNDGETNCEHSFLQQDLCKNHEYLFLWLQKQQRKLSYEFFTFYLSLCYLSNKKYLKSIQYLMKARKINNDKGKLFQTALNQLIHLEVQNYQSIYKSLKIIIQKENRTSNICLINHQYQVLFTIDHIDCISMEFQIQQLIKKIQKVFQTIIKIQIILSKNSSFTNSFKSRIIRHLLLEKLEQKHQIQKLIQAMHSKGHYNKKFIFLNYVYLNICCSQVYTVFEKLQPLLEVITDDTNKYLEKKSSENDMMVMVSIQDEHIGLIEHANIIMKTFFSLKEDKIKSKTERIQKIIPKFVASQHNELMMHFKKTGKSNFIGQRNKLIVIQNQEKPYEANIDIKIFVLLDGSVSLTSRIMIVKEQTNIVLFNSFGQIFQNNLNLSVNTSIKRKGKIGILNFFTMIDVTVDEKVQKITPQILTTHFQNKLAKIKIESLQIKGNNLGICKIQFINKALIDIEIMYNRTTQQQINQFKSLSEKQIHKYTSKDIKCRELELKIWDMKQTHHPQFLWFTFAFIIIAIVSILIVGYSFGYIQNQFSYSSSITAFYANIVNGLRTRFYSMNIRYLLLHAINKNYISNNITSKYNISNLSQYIKNTTTPYLSSYDILDSMILNYSGTIPLYQIKKFTSQTVYYISPYKFQTSWVSMLSLMKSFYYQSILSSQYVFENMWDNYILPYNTYLSNSYSTQISNNVFVAIMNGSIDALDNVQTNIFILICIMCILLFLAIVTILFLNYKFHRQTEECISLLTEIEIVSLKEQEKKIKLIKEILKELSRMMIINYEIEQEFETIRYYLGDESYLMMKYGEVYFQRIKSTDSDSCCLRFNKNKITHYPQSHLQLSKNISFMGSEAQFQKKKKFQAAGFTTIHLKSIIIIILLYLPFFAMFLCTFIISTSNYKAVTFLYNYVNQICTFRASQAIMLNIVAAQLVLPNVPTFNNMDVETIIPSLNNVILNRTYEDILKKSLSWNIVENFIYKPNCKPTDEICKNLISGSLNQNIPAAIIQFDNLNFVLYENANKTNISTLSKYQLLCQLWITYEVYLRPILLQALMEGLAITNSELSAAQNQITLIFYSGIFPFTVFFLIVSYWITYRIFKEYHEIKKQVLMSDRVDKLINKIRFSSQFIKLKQN